MIRSFKSRDTARLNDSERVKQFEAFESVARRKLRMLDAAVSLTDLRVPPNNRLEAPRGSRKGQHSIRINDQWRLCFVWKYGHAEDVEIVDYH
jgi:proteic killer suppression protein